MTAKKRTTAKRKRASRANGKLGGRPTAFSKARGQKIVEAIRKGALLEIACAFAGVTRQTLYRWLKKGEEDIGIGKRTVLAKWKAEVDAATAECEVSMTGIVAKAALSDWKAAAFVLERRFPERWSRHQTIGKPTDPAPRRDLSKLSVDELREMRAKLRKTRVDEEPAEGRTVH